MEGLRILVKVKFRSEQKFVKISQNDLKLSDFLDEAFVKFGIAASSRPEARLYDDSGTEVDEDVFEDVLKQPNLSVFQLRLENSSNGNVAPDIQVLGYDGDWFVGRENVQLLCRAKANPPAQHFRWIRFDGDVPDGADVLNNSLVFAKPLQKNDSGVYRCEVANDIGHQSRDIRIRIQDPPSTTTMPTTMPPTTPTTMPPTTPVRLLTADISATGPGIKQQALITSPTLAPLPDVNLCTIVCSAVTGTLFLLLLLVLARVFYQRQRRTKRRLPKFQS